jgi:DNA-binding NtrC family response regulator
MIAVITSRRQGFAGIDYLRPEDIRRIVDACEVNSWDKDRGMQTVLVIDDDWSIREVTTMMLEHAGYKAISASTSEDSIAIMSANRVSLALVDVIMPGKNGLELALEINQKWPLVPIILMSGKVPTEADSIKNFTGHFGIAGSISKPFTKEQLVEAVTAALEGK